MRCAWVLLAVAVFATGCGTAESRHPTSGTTLSAYGMSVEVPPGWSGRIVLGRRATPVLHIASFALPANDDDSGELATEALEDMYLNAHGLGRSGSAEQLPVSFSPADFSEPDPPSGFRRASRDVAASGELFRLTAISGDRGPPSAALVARLNEVLGTLVLERYVPESVPSLPVDAKLIDGHGTSMRLPPSWDGTVERGELTAASPEIRLRLRLLENGTSPQGAGPPFITGVPPIQLSPAEFVRAAGESDPHVRAMSGRSFVDNGRSFVLWVNAGSLPPSIQAVDEANQALASLHVEAGDFYPGTVQPARFEPSDGWQTGTNGAVEVQPDGQQTWTWASTVAYLDEPFQLPPSKTLAHLPLDGIVIAVQLYGPDPRVGEGGPVASLPFEVGDTEAESFEGMPPRFSLCSLGGRAQGQRYSVEVFVIFGRAQPDAAQLAAADAELARLHLPNWTSTD